MGSEVKLLGDSKKDNINSDKHWLQPPTEVWREAALRAFKVSGRLNAATLKWKQKPIPAANCLTATALTSSSALRCHRTVYLER